MVNHACRNFHVGIEADCRWAHDGDADSTGRLRIPVNLVSDEISVLKDIVLKLDENRKYIN